MDEDAVIAVVGGGVVGTSILSHLAERGYTNSVLFEKGQLGEGSTSKAAGGVRNVFSHPVNVRLGNRNIEFFRELERDAGVEFERSGYAYLFHSPDAEREWRRREEMLDEYGVESEVLTAEEVTERWPYLAGRFDGAFFAPDCGHVDPYRVTQAFAARAREAGATIHTKTEVRDVRTEGNAVTAVETDDGPYRVDAVVNAAGPWSGRVAEMVGLDLPLSLFVRRIVVTTPSGYRAGPLFLDPELECYFRVERDGSILLCDTEQDIHGAVDPNGATDRELGYQYYLGAFEKLERLVPDLGDPEVMNGWGGIQTHTPDGHAVLGTSPVEGFLLACGFCGHGVQQAPSVGRALAEVIADGRTEVLPIERLGPDRFDAADRIAAEEMA